MNAGSSLWRPALLAAALFLVPTSVTLEAHASSAQDRAAADALFDSGVRLMEEENYAEACVKFEKSHALDPGVGTLLNLARCFELAGKTASAWTTYREASSLARQEGQADREEHAREQAKALEPKLIRLQLNAADGLTDLGGLKIEQDGTMLVVEAVVGEAIPIDGGTHRIVVSADGYLPKSYEVVTAQEGETYPLKLEMLEEDPEAATAAAAAAEPASAQPSPEPAPEPQAEPHKRSPGPPILAGVGVVAAGVGTVFAFKAKGHDNSARDICKDPRDACSRGEVRDWERELDSAKSSATIAYLGWGVGGAALVGALVWYVTDSPSGSSSHAKFKVTPLVGYDSWGLGARGSF